MQTSAKKNSLNPSERSSDSSYEMAPEADEGRVAQLLSDIARGNERAMETLYKMFSRKIYAYALHRCNDATEAEEAVIETMHEVWKHPERFRGESKFSTWLIGIARHKMIDAMRAREPEHSDIEEYGEILADDSMSAFEMIAERQRRRGVEDCMQKLSQEHRECLHLTLYQELSLIEVARMQNVPENTVKTRLFHARKNMKDCLSRLLSREA